MEIGREVLIVEDDSTTRSLLADVAEYVGFHSTLAGDGTTAMTHLATKKFDVLLLDLLLPRTNGFEVLRHLKCTDPKMLRRTIVMTAAGEPTTRDCAELQEVWKFFHKPLEVDDLAAQMLACIGEQTEEESRASDPGHRPLAPGNGATAR